MRQTKLISLCLTAAIALSACEKQGDAKVNRTLKDLNVIDESNLSSIMLTVGDPNEAVAYFRKSSAENPDRIDLQRGLAKSLVRANKPREASVIWAKIVQHPESTNEDRVELADSLIRTNDWKKAKTVLDSVPPTYETFKRYRLEAMVADSNKDWKKSDSFYEIAVGLTTNPGNVLNNWGYSKLTRGDYSAAERLFNESLTYNRNSFTAKNNLALARGAQRNYTLPVVPMTQTERAQLLYTLALSAIKQGDVATGKSLLKEAIDTHPQHFEAASRSLKALENNVTN
ncbi:MAG TPA: tetratricopeptide repeat protein [Rhodobacteraceae bacterium]|nr:tetratricopeptide repeat protein [Paracoccaceae bacterium]